MSAVVLDASAGVEVVLRGLAGRRLAKMLDGYTHVWVPEVFSIEVAAVLRRKALSGEITSDRADRALELLLSLHATRASVKLLMSEAWTLRTMSPSPMPCMSSWPGVSAHRWSPETGGSLGRPASASA